jgi:hypothetical protein
MVIYQAETLSVLVDRSIDRDRHPKLRVPNLPEVLQKLFKTLGVLKASKFLKLELCPSVRLCSNAFECSIIAPCMRASTWRCQGGGGDAGTTRATTQTHNAHAAGSATPRPRPSGRLRCRLSRRRALSRGCRRRRLRRSRSRSRSRCSPPLSSSPSSPACAPL